MTNIYVYILHYIWRKPYAKFQPTAHASVSFHKYPKKFPTATRWLPALRQTSCGFLPGVIISVFTLLLNSWDIFSNIFQQELPDRLTIWFNISNSLILPEAGELRLPWNMPFSAFFPCCFAISVGISHPVAIYLSTVQPSVTDVGRSGRPIRALKCKKISGTCDSTSTTFRLFFVLFCLMLNLMFH